MSLPQDDTAHLDRILYLFGRGIQHSLSPILHQTVYRSLGLNWEYRLNDQDALAPCLEAMRHPKFHGAAVTMPYKVDIVPHLDMLTPEGHAIGAINTIYLRKEQDRRLVCGTNTDCVGIREAILKSADPAILAAARGRPAMVIGGGGTCRAAVYALKQYLGFDTIYLVNRDRSEVESVIHSCASHYSASGLVDVADVSQALSLPAPGLVVSAIPDFAPSTPAEHTVRQIIQIMLNKSPTGVLLEMCYHPSPNTKVRSLALDADWQVISGIQAMIWQGMEQERLWTEREVVELPVEKVKASLAAELSRAHL